ncbi:MAG TPA: Bax inhibitor-1/YccA family protein [Tepidisphaeraceae bacterium]|jgi:hypothetical protein|nr:Bax inhibitor-1/YccA family protein [Tepidisphaeraceae bacterium]
MSQIPGPFGSFQQPRSHPLDYEGQQVNQAIAGFFNVVYAWMFAGLALTAVVAWYVAQHSQILQNLGNGIWLLFIVELVLVGVVSQAIYRINTAVATVLFLTYAGLNGVVLAVLFLIYTHTMLASAFAVSAGMFGAMSLYGFVTKRDLTAMGRMMYMALIGLIIASVVSFFVHSSALEVLINYVGVIIFVGLTAYDTQKLKKIAIATSGNAAMASRLAISGALILYLDFLNLFLMMLELMGGNSRR